MPVFFILLTRILGKSIPAFRKNLTCGRLWQHCLCWVATQMWLSVVFLGNLHTIVNCLTWKSPSHDCQLSSLVIIFPAQVGGIVITNRPDSKNAQYQDCIKQGDILLNRYCILSTWVTFMPRYFYTSIEYCYFQGPETIPCDQHLEELDERNGIVDEYF